jgi:hypothetical protein
MLFQLHQRRFREMMLLANTYQKQTVTEAIFTEEELVTWHYQNGNKQIPLPAVVVRQETQTIIIQAYLNGKLQQFGADPDQLINR